MSLKVARFGTAERLTVRRLRDTAGLGSSLGNASGCCGLREARLMPRERGPVRALPFLAGLALPAALALLRRLNVGFAAPGGETFSAIAPAAVSRPVVLGKGLRPMLDLACSASL